MIPVFIPFANRFDLLSKAIASIPQQGIYEPEVINNSGANLDVMCPVITPPILLTFTQSQNFMLKLAKERKVPFYFFMHSDAEADPVTIERLYQKALYECSQQKWGAIFTNYDAMAAFNAAAMNAIGGWDEGFEWYHSDSDCYRRLRLAGYPTLESNLSVKHEPSQTLKADPIISAKVNSMFNQRVERYHKKWGGDVGHETFDIPWGGK